jgi:hypothetical protein
MIKSEVTNDQFYTKHKIANDLINKTKSRLKSIDMYVEPSAGSGAFYRLLPETYRLGLDIDPKISEIEKIDYFDFNSDMLKESYSNICVIGNPPFGKNSSLAVKFFNHSASFAKYIAFILPRTFRKDSIVNRLNRSFHLTYEEILNKNSFELLDKSDYSVPCVFQIWERKSNLRDIIIKDRNHKDWTWVSKTNNPDFAIRRVGVNAGKIYKFNDKISESSHYFLKSNDKVFENFNVLFNKDYKFENNNTQKYDTVGNPSLSMPNLVEDYKRNFN